MQAIRQQAPKAGVYSPGVVASKQSFRSPTRRITNSLRIKTKTPELTLCICGIAIPFAGVEADDRQEWLRHGIYRTLAVTLH